MASYYHLITYIFLCKGTTPSHLPYGHTHTHPHTSAAPFQLRASICTAVTHSDYKGPACDEQSPILLTITDNKMNIANEKSSGFPFQPRAGDRIGPLHLCVTLGFVQARHIFIGIKINVMAGGQQPLLYPLPIHTHTHPHYHCLFMFVIFLANPIFSHFLPPAPSAMVERVLISDPIATLWLVMWQPTVAIKSRGVLFVWAGC